MGAPDLSPYVVASPEGQQAFSLGNLAARWGVRLCELTSGDLTPDLLTVPLRRALQAHAFEVIPRLLGGGVVADGVLRACVTRYACTNDARFGRSHPSDVVVSVDLAAGTWNTSRGDAGADLVSLVRWYWHGSTTATARNVGELRAEGLLLALLGLAAFDLSNVGGAK